MVRAPLWSESLCGTAVPTQPGIHSLTPAVRLDSCAAAVRPVSRGIRPCYGADSQSQAEEFASRNRHRRVVAAAMVGGGVGAATLLENERANDATAIKAPVAQASVQP